MFSRLKNTILSVRRYQRHLKCGFIIADEDVSNVIGDIINWCSFNVRGAGSLIYTLSALNRKFDQSLLKEHSPDIFIKVGNIPESTTRNLERKYQPFGIWDWNEMKDSENDPANLSNVLGYMKKRSGDFKPWECLVSSNDKGDSLFLLSAILLGCLLPQQRESIKDYLRLLDVSISKADPMEILKHQRFGGIINFSKFLFWPKSESYDSSRCYDIFERRHEPFHYCFVVDDINNWDNFSLFWNLRTHFGAEEILFLPTFLFHDKEEVLTNFLWDNLKDNHKATILSHSLPPSEILELLRSVPNAKLEGKHSKYILKLKRNRESKSVEIKTQARDWSEIFGKIIVNFGRVDRIPVYFSESGGMVEVPEAALFDPNLWRALYAIDFEIPFFRPPKSINLRHGLGLGSQIRISSTGLTIIQGTGIEEKFVPVRVLDPIRAIKYIVSDRGFDARESSNGKMATRFLSLLQDFYELHTLSGEDVVDLLKKSNPLVRKEGKTVKKPDEVAAVNWGRMQEFLNISDEPYLTQEFAGKIVSWMVSRDLLKLGVKVKCENCYNEQWIPVDQIREKMHCSACFSELSMPLGGFHHLEWKYLLNLLLGRAIDQGFLTPLLTIYYLNYENWQSEEKMTYFSPGVDIFRNGDHVAELDLFVVSEGEIIIGECKIGHDVSEEEIDKLISVGEDIGADVILFSTLSEFSKECVDLISKKANQTELKIVMLQRDQLLNQAPDRRLMKQRPQPSALEKSYRQIFVESLIREI